MIGFTSSNFKEHLILNFALPAFAKASAGKAIESDNSAVILERSAAER